MRERALRAAIAGLMALCCVAAACASTTRAQSIVALGDSVPYGTNCSCTPYPTLTATDLSAMSHRTFKTTNDSKGGYTTNNVLDQLDSNASVMDHVKAADVVEIEIGANDVGFNSTCGTKLSCYEPKIPAIKSNLGAIVKQTKELAGPHVLVVLLDYWSVWLGGKYAEAKGQAYVNTAEQLTDDVDSVIKSTASNTGAAYVDLRAAFKGPDYSYDETHYLSSDGDHPNASGHEQIAAAAEAVIARRLHIRL
jgi:lysophospholipase L1-like esterase